MLGSHHSLWNSCDLNGRVFDFWGHFLLCSYHVLRQVFPALWNIQFVCLSSYFSTSFLTFSIIFFPTHLGHCYSKVFFLLQIKQNWLTVNNNPYKMSLHLFLTFILILLLYCHFTSASLITSNSYSHFSAFFYLHAKTPISFPLILLLVLTATKLNSDCLLPHPLCFIELLAKQ